ncbi:MAG: transporter [Caulobacter sp.]|nr:transporter [Caulobacter sp.]
MQVAILTPADDETLYQTMWPAWFARLEAGLAGSGVAAIAHDWTRPLAAPVDAVLPMLAWGYHRRPDQWLQRLDAFEAAGQRMINPAAVLRWNTDKAYLAELEAGGAPVVPTISVEALTAADVEAARERFGALAVIAKPRVSGGSHQTVKLLPGDSLDDAPTGPALLQPFLPAVGDEGEISLLYFDGVFSHAVAKVAARGDFRVQPQFGGQVARVKPWPGALETAAAVLAAVPPLTYARVDLLRGPGGLLLMELEAIEPDLFLTQAPKGAGRFGAAVKAALSA